jgi:hypothetical protein
VEGTWSRYEYVTKLGICVSGFPERSSLVLTAEWRLISFDSGNGAVVLETQFLSRLLDLSGVQSLQGTSGVQSFRLRLMLETECKASHKNNNLEFN